MSNWYAKLKAAEIIYPEPPKEVNEAFDRAAERYSKMHSQTQEEDKDEKEPQGK
jgi:hypothetical protein